MTKWIFNRLNSNFDKDSFDCGNRQLNEYLNKYASQNMTKGYSKTFVATRPGSNEIAGYYCCSASVIKFESIPPSLSKRLPKYPAPAMLVGQLAVDLKMQGQGLGKALLINAFDRVVRVNEEMAIFAVKVDALDTEAKEFYLKHGFIPFQDKELSLLLPMKTILKLFPSI